MSLDAIAAIVAGVALLLNGAIVFIGLQKAKRLKRRDLRKEARRMDELVGRNKPKAYRCLGGASGPTTEHPERKRVGL